MKRKKLTVLPLPGFEPEIGRWIWGLEDVRRTLLEKLTGLSRQQLDAKQTGHAHSVGTLLYHIALIEADWLYEEVLTGEWDPKIRALFPQEDRNPDDTLISIVGEDLHEHLHRLHAVREELLFHFRAMDVEDWRTPKKLAPYDVTPEWVIYHLIEHESHHRGQIFQLLSILKEQNAV